MRLTLHSDYALRLLMYLANAPDRVVPLPEIAEAYAISRNHLAKVAQTLRGAGFVDALRGQSGGLRLARDPRAVRLGDVVRSTEPDFNIVECFAEGHGGCPLSRNCTLASVLDRARAAFLAELDAVTLEDLVRDREVRSRLVEIGQGAARA